MKIVLAVIVLVILSGCSTPVKIFALPLYQTPIEIKGVCGEQNKYALTIVKVNF